MVKLRIIRKIEIYFTFLFLYLILYNLCVSLHQCIYLEILIFDYVKIMEFIFFFF